MGGDASRRAFISISAPRTMTCGFTGSTVCETSQEEAMRDLKQQRIAGTALFSGCTKAEVAFVAGHADCLDVGAGSTLALEGRSVREFIVLVDGVASGDGVVYGPGSFFGAAELLDGRTYASTIE